MEGQAQGSQNLAASLSSMWLQCGLGLWMVMGFFDDFNIVLTGATNIYLHRLQCVLLFSIYIKGSNLENVPVP